MIWKGTERKKDWRLSTKEPAGSSDAADIMEKQ